MLFCNFICVLQLFTNPRRQPAVAILCNVPPKGKLKWLSQDLIAVWLIYRSSEWLKSYLLSCTNTWLFCDVILATSWENCLRGSDQARLKPACSATETYLISSQSLKLGGRRGTTDDVATIHFYPSLSSVALRESTNPIPVHSLMLSSHLFFCLPLRIAPFTVPCQGCSTCIGASHTKVPPLWLLLLSS